MQSPFYNWQRVIDLFGQRSYRNRCSKQSTRRRHGTIQECARADPVSIESGHNEEWLASRPIDSSCNLYDPKGEFPVTKSFREGGKARFRLITRAEQPVDRANPLRVFFPAVFDAKAFHG